MDEFKTYNGNIKKIKKWLDDNRLNINKALYWSVYKNHLKPVCLLIKSYANINADNDIAFYISVYNKNTEIMKELIKAGASSVIYSIYDVPHHKFKYDDIIHHTSKNNNIKDMILLWAIRDNHIEIVREIIKVIDNKDVIYKEALYMSKLYGNIDVICELISTDINKQYNLNELLCWSIKYGYSKIAHELIKANININDNEPLYLSISRKNIKITHELMKYYKYINRFNEFIKKICDSRAAHYTRIISIIFDLPRELYDELGDFI